MKKFIYVTICSLIGSSVIAQVENGLIAKYPFNGNANDVVSGHHGNVFGATLTTDRFGISDAAYLFDQVNSDYIEVPYHADFTPDSMPMSISVWFHATSNDTLDETGSILSWYRCGAVPNCGGGDDGAFYTINRTDSSRVVFWVRDDVNNDSTFATAPWFNNGNWHHLVLMFDATENYQKYYVNNILMDSVTVAMTSLSDGGNSIPLSFGRVFRTGWGDPENYFSGKIDDIRFYDRVLSAVEIDSLYHEGGFVSIPEDRESLELLVYPNPTYDFAWINNTSSTTLHFTLFNILGKEILIQTLNMGDNMVDFSELSNDIYLYRISSKDQVLRTGTLIKM